MKIPKKKFFDVTCDISKNFLAIVASCAKQSANASLTNSASSSADAFEMAGKI